MAPIRFPFHDYNYIHIDPDGHNHFNNKQFKYPTRYDESFSGEWYSFPAGGRCPVGAKVGEGGCTWQRSPTVHTVYIDHLNLRRPLDKSKRDSALGIVKIPVTDSRQAYVDRRCVDVETAKHNIEIGKQAFAKLGVMPCGPG